MDCYSKRIVGYAMAEHMRTELVQNALEMAVPNLHFFGALWRRVGSHVSLLWA